MNNQILYSNNGIVTLPDGTVIYVVEIQFSHNGINYWEDKYNPKEHIYEEDGVTLISGHKYMRLRKSGNTEFEKPMYITAVDGDHPVLRATDEEIQYKLSLQSDAEYKDIISINELKGPVGPKGEDGKGIEIHRAGALDTRPSCTDCASLPNPCGGGTYEEPITIFASLGNHKVISEDISTATQDYYHIKGLDDSGSITGWVKTETQHEGEYVMAWKSTSSDNTSGDALTVNKQGVVVNLDSYTGGFYSNAFDSTGVIFICSDEIWEIAMNINAPDGFLRMDSTDSLAYLEDKLDATTIGKNINGKAEVLDDSIGEPKLVFDWLGNGLTYDSNLVKPILGDGFVKNASDFPSNNKLQINKNDFIDHGLNIKVGTDGFDNFRVNTDDLNGFGLLSFQPTTLPSGDKVLKVDNTQLVGRGLKADRAPVNDYLLDLDVDATYFLLDSSNSYKLTLKDQGITGNKLNTNLAGQGLSFIDTDADTVEDTLIASLDTSKLVFNASDQITIASKGIDGGLLADSVAGDGIAYNASSPRGLKADLNTSKLEFDGGKISVKDSYVDGRIPSDLFTAKSGTDTSLLNRNDTLTFAAANPQSLLTGDVSLDTGTNTLTITFNHSQSVLDTIIDNRVNTSYVYSKLKSVIVDNSYVSFDDTGEQIEITATGSSISAATTVSPIDGTYQVGTSTNYAREDHKHQIADNSIEQAKIMNLSTTLDSKLGMDTSYGTSNSRYKFTNSGMILIDTNGTERYVKIDEFGQIYADTV